MIGEEYLPYEYLTVAPTELSIAEYSIATDTILFWSWNIQNAPWYAKPTETGLEMVVRIVAHEEMHRILYKLEGGNATFAYDNCTTTDIDDLP